MEEAQGRVIRLVAENRSRRETLYQVARATLDGGAMSLEVLALIIIDLFWWLRR